ncbi:MAG: hypothetical protein U0946_05540, partial [Patescibacteria group bacterium]|nr:hypothetical protein [Patescibacteria group bacterium]
MPAQDSKLLELLWKQEKLKKEDYDRVAAEILAELSSAEDLLIKHNLVSETVIAQAKAEVLKVPYIDVSATSISPEALNLLPEAVAEKYLVLPFAFDKEKQTLSIVMANPVDLQALSFIEKKTGMRLQPFLGETSKLIKQIKERYAQSLSTEVTEALKETSTSQAKKITMDELSGGVIREAPIAKIVSTILEFAI